MPVHLRASARSRKGTRGPSGAWSAPLGYNTDRAKSVAADDYAMHKYVLVVLETSTCQPLFATRDLRHVAIDNADADALDASIEQVLFVSL